MDCLFHLPALIGMWGGACFACDRHHLQSRSSGSAAASQRAGELQGVGPLAQRPALHGCRLHVGLSRFRLQQRGHCSGTPRRASTRAIPSQTPPCATCANPCRDAERERSRPRSSTPSRCARRAAPSTPPWRLSCWLPYREPSPYHRLSAGGPGSWRMYRDLFQLSSLKVECYNWKERVS